MKRIHIALAACFALAMASCGTNNTPEKAVENFYKYSQENDIEQALQYANVPEEERENVAQYIEQMGFVIIDYKILNSVMDEGDTTATVSMTLTSTNAYNPEPVEVTREIGCIKQGKEWKIML